MHSRSYPYSGFFCATAMLLAAWLLPSISAAGEGEPGPVPVIDVLFAYTPAALAEGGSYLSVQQMVDDANRVLLNSGARARVRLVHTAKVAYVEPYVYDSHKYQLTLDRLTNPQDGYLDELHALREQYAADIVVLWVKSAQQGFEGYVAPLLPDAAHAFGVVFPQNSYDFVRLLGRMLGCEAQRGPLDETWRVVGEGAFADSHAYVFTNWNYVNSTVMGARLNLTPFFSNPELVCFESRLGIPGEADNVRTINLKAPTVAAFRGSDNSINAPGIEWLSPLGGARFLPGSDITLDVLVNPGGGAVQKVELFKATSYTELHERTALANLTPQASGHFGVVLTNSTPGWYRVSARATDDLGATRQETIEFRVRAGNDDFTNRIQLQTPKDRVAVDLRGMTLEPGEAELAAPGVQATAWYAWTSPGEGYLQVRAQAKDVWSPLLPFIRAYFGTDLGHLTPSGVNPDRNSPLLLRVHPGDMVQLSVGYARSEVLAVELTADFLPLLTNDSFGTRTPVAGPAVMITGHNVGARSSTNAIWPNGMGPTAWWSWTPNVTGFAQIQASNFVPQQTMVVFKGGQPEALADLAQLSPDYVGRVGTCFPVKAGEPLPVAVSSREGNPVGAFNFRLAVLEGAPNNTFSNRLTRSGSEWMEKLLFPVESAAGAPAGVGPYASWWEWTAPQSGIAVVASSAWDAPNVVVFTGDSAASLQPVQTIQSSVGFAAFTVAAGMRYHLALSWSSVPYYLGSGFGPVLHLGYASANDSFSNRTMLNGPSVDWDLTSAYGTREQSEPNSPLASWWYSWTAPARGRVTLSATGQVGIAVFRGNALGQLTNVISQQYWSSLPTFVAEAGVEYKIQAWTSSLDYLPVSARLHLGFQPPPANDQFAGRVLLTGPDYTISADLGLPTADPADPIIPGTSYRRTLWWRWIIPSDGVAKFSSSWAALGVYRLAENGTLVPVVSTTAAAKQLGVKAGEALELMLAGEEAPYLGSFRLELLPADSGTFANDSFAGRTELVPSNGNPLSLGASAGTTEGATREPGESLSGTNLAGHSRWATWRTPVPAMAKVSVSTSGGSGLYAEQFRGSQLASMGTVAWNTGPYLVFRFHADPGFEYPLAVDSSGTNDVSYTIEVELTPDAAAPTNDLFQTAQILPGPAAKVTGTHRRATAESGEPAHAGAGPQRSLWYRWVASRTGTVRLWTKPVSLDYNTPYDTTPYPPGTLAEPHRAGLGVYVGNTVASLAAQSCRSLPSTNAYESIVEFDAIAGESYAVALEGGAEIDADIGEFELQLVQLTTNDDWANRIILQGATVLLSGTVFGATRPANEWTAQWPSQSANTNLMNTWWEWTAPANLRVTLRNVRSNEHFWAVWRSTDQRQYPPRTSVMDRYFGWEDTRRDFVATAGQTFYVAVYAYSNNATPVEIELEGVPVPANDNFAGRIALTGERVSLAARGDNTSRELNEPPHGVGIVGIGYGNVTNAPSLWWSWTAPRSGLFSLTTGPQEGLRSQTAGRWDQVVRTECFVYQGDQITSLSLVVGTTPDTSSPPSGLKRVTFAAVAGNTYQIALCPIIREARVWDTTRYFVNLTIQPVTANSSVDAALELTGSCASFSGNLAGEIDGLWWRWTAPASGSVYFAQRMGGADLSRSVLIQTYTRNPTNGVLTLQSDSEVLAGETYWLKASAQLLDWSETPPTWDGRDLPFAAALGLKPLTLSNDNFAQRELVTGSVAVLVGDNTDATREPGEPMHAGQPGRGSLWYRWVAPHSGRWTLDLVNSWYGPVCLDVYRGDTLSSLQRVPSDRNSMLGDLVFQAQGGETYSIVVDNPGYPTGAFQVNLIEYLPPANDSFAGRIRLSGSAPSWTASNSGASAEPGEPFHAGCVPGASVWYAWTAQKNGPVNLAVDSAGGLTAWAPPRVAVYRGESLASLVPVGANRIGGDLTSNLVFRAEANVSYSIAVDTLPQEIGGFRLALTPTNAPLNDNFSDRIALTGSQVRVYALNGGATLEPGEPNPGDPDVGATLWWTWTAAGSGPVTIDTAGSSFDTRLAVYQGSTLGLLSLVVGNDDATPAAGSPAPFTSSVTFNASRGAAYQIQAGGLGGGFGRLTLNLASQEAPLSPAEIVSAQVVIGSKTCVLRLRGTPGQVASVQGSSDLVNWQPAGSVRFVSSDAVWSEPIAAGVAKRFFRLAFPMEQGGAPPQLLSAGLVEGSGICRLYLRGTAGQNASVQGSSDLANWETLDSVHFISDREAWSQPILPGVAARFYRLKSH